MSYDQGITRELSLGEIVSKTFDLFRRNLVKYALLFLIVEVAVGLVSVWAYNAFPFVALPARPTLQEALNRLTNALYLIGVEGIAFLFFGTIAYASTIKMASEEIESKPVNLGGAVRFAVSKLIWIWALGLIVGIIVGLGFIALVIPGIILAMMFFLSFQALLIENTGVTESMSRSRELVRDRWLKTFAVAVVFAIIVGIASAIVSAITTPIGYWSQLVSSIISAFYLPIIPVASTVYFYSNRARITQIQMGAAPMAPAAMPAPGMKFCPNCGTQLAAAATFCSKCGAKQPT